MKRASKFTVSPGWKVLLSDMQIDVPAVLTHARLPADLFNRDNQSLTVDEYFRLWQGIEEASGERDVALLLAKHMTMEAFDAPLFASICCADFNSALQRIQHYKPLIGPILMDLKITSQSTTLSLSCYEANMPIPTCLGMTELVFFTQLARLATRQNIVPIEVAVPSLPDNLAKHEAYFGCPVKVAEHASLSISAKDAKVPFLTANAQMWEFFEGKLNQKLADLDAQASTSERLKALLLETLPAGDASVETAAAKLAMSKRTLQRKLTAEAESFQSVLQAVRAELADHYLQKSQLSLGEISFLLGFQESNSFIRAYSGWKGMSPGHFRDQCH